MELHFAGCELTHESAVILTELIKVLFICLFIENTIMIICLILIN